MVINHIDWVRIGSPDKDAHLARLSDAIGSTLCGYEPRMVDDVRLPGQPFGRPTRICSRCAEIAYDRHET